jgi:pimeloyl-ACP methyl ester carboxylesterase
MTLGNATALRLASGEEIEVFLHASGHAQKCLFIHGNPGSASDWAPVLSHLSNVADVAAFDLPGFGSSRADTDDLSLNAMAARSLAVGDALGWKAPFFVVGHSHGGGVAQALAVRRPDRVFGLVLLATLGFPSHLGYRLLSLPGAQALMRGVGHLLQSNRWRKLARFVINRFLSDIFSPEPVPASRRARELDYFSNRPDVLVNMQRLTLGSPCRALLASASNIGCRVMFLHGQNDRIVPVACARTIHDRIQSAGGHSRFEVLPGAGHMLIEFQAAEIAASIARFIGMGLSR